MSITRRQFNAVTVGLAVSAGLPVAMEKGVSLTPEEIREFVNKTEGWRPGSSGAQPMIAGARRLLLREYIENYIQEVGELPVGKHEVEFYSSGRFAGGKHIPTGPSFVKEVVFPSHSKL